jgi:hypothetical protein
VPRKLRDETPAELPSDALCEAEEAWIVPAKDLSNVGLEAEWARLESRKEIDTLSDEEVGRYQEVAEERERRHEHSPSHYNVNRDGSVTKTEKGPAHMTMFDPSEVGGLDDVQEPKAVEAGEYKLAVLSVRSGETAEEKGARSYWLVTFEIPSEPDSKDFTHFLWVPGSGKHTPKQLRDDKWKLQQCMQCFALPYDRPFVPAEDWPGAEGWALLSKTFSPKYGWQNQVDNFIIPK